MEISKSTPYVRYRENISSSLHKGTVHIESEYLDRERKTTIESIEGQTWQNLVANENKDLEMLGVGSIGLSGDIYDTGEKRLAVDIVMGNTTPTVNEDGTYTYSVSTLEGEYARTFDGVNRITSTSDGLDGEFHIKYNTQSEEIIGNFSTNGEESHIIENSKNGEITSVVLKGQTLVNYFNPNSVTEFPEDGFALNEADFSKQRVFTYKPLQPYESNTEYTIIAWLKDVVNPNGVQLNFAFGGTDLYINNFKNGVNIAKGTTRTLSDTSVNIRIGNVDVQNGAGATLLGAVVLKGDYTDQDIPYFLGIQSVKNPSVKTSGENIFDWHSIEFLKNGNQYTSNFKSSSPIRPFKVEEGEKYVVVTKGSVNDGQYSAMYFGGDDLKYSSDPNNQSKAFIVQSGGGVTLKDGVERKFLVVARKTCEVTRIMIHGSGGTSIYSIDYIGVFKADNVNNVSYTPYKTNILTTNEDVTLRGIGDVKDVLDCNTNEVTEKIGEIVLDGSENWVRRLEKDKTLLFQTTAEVVNGKTSYCLSDKLPHKNNLWSSSIDEEGVAIGGSKLTVIDISIAKTKLNTPDTEGFKTYLQANPITMLYQLAESYTKTVTTSIKDQDGKTSRQLSTYDSITHVNVSSDGLIPLADISYKMYSTTDVVSGTSVTIEDGKDSDMVEGVVYGNSMVNIAHGVNLPQEQTRVDFQVTNLQEGRTYTIFYDVSAADSGNLPRIGIVGRTTANEGYDNWLVNQSNISLGSGKIVFTMPPFYSVSYLRIHKNDSKSEPICVNKMMLLEGDYTDQDIPYFEGISSVENPLVVVSGKNLFNPSKHTSISYDGLLYTCQLASKDEGAYYHLEPNTEYRIKVTSDTPNVWFKVHVNGNFNNGAASNYLRFTTDGTGKTFIKFGGNSEVGRCRNIYMSKVEDFIGENFTLPPVHANLSTTPQITLHGIGNVKDEWDMVNETVTRRIGEVLLDGETTKVTHFRDVGSDYATFRFHYPHKNPTNRICDKLPDIYSGWTTEKESVSWYINNEGFITLLKSKLGGNSSELANTYLSNHPVRILYLSNEMIPTTEPVYTTPQNPKTSTASITINEQLNAVDAIHDKLRWNPYKGCYVRYNHIVDGVSYDQHRTIENLYDLGERQYVDLYEHRTYFLPTNGSMESRTHGTSVYCLAEQGKQYCVRWDWIEAPTVDTIKVDLCGNTKIIPSTETSVVIDATHVQHSFVQLQGNGLQGRFTNLMVIETIDGEIPDVDFFSGVKAIGNTVQIDGATKVQIDVEQTNGNLFDADLEIQSNGNVVRTINNALQSIRPNKKYVMKQHNLNLNKTNNTYLLTRDGEATRTLGLVPERAPEGLVFTTTYREEKYRILINASNNGSANVHYPIELCYADMIKDSIRPCYHDMQSFILPMKLCRVGEVYDNLYYDDLKGYYRIQQSIGHKYFTGDTSERWEMGAINLNSRTVAFTYKNGDINQLAMGDTICNGFKRLKDVNQDTEGFIIYNGDFVLRIDKERIEGNCSIDGLRAYLTSYPIHLFYQLKTPQMVDLPQYPNRLELNTYRDEVFTFIKDSNPTKFTLSIPMDRTYRFDDHQEGQGLANRVSITDERISSENVVAIQEIRGKGIANLIEDPNNVPVTPLPNYSGVATSHQLTNTKPSIVHIHGFEPSGDTKIGTWNATDKKYQIKVMSGNNNYSLSDYYVLDVPCQLETYPDGTKDRVYYNAEHQEWQVNGSYDRTIAFNASTGAFTEAVEIFRGMTPRSGMIAEFKLRFTSGTTTARLYYSVNGSTYSYVTLRGMVDDQDYYLAFFNTGGTKIDYSTKVGATTEYASMTALSATIPEGLFVNQIQSITECTHYVDKFYQYPTLHTPIELDTYDGTTNIYIDGKTTDTNIIINNDSFQKVVNTYEDVEYTVYWKYLSGDGKLTITLGGTKVEVDGTKEYATIRTQLQASQELVYIGGYNLSIQDVMVVKGARIDGLAYFEGSRQVGTLVVDEHGNKQYKITLVQGGSVLEQKDYDKVEFKDDNKHNVVVHKIVGVRPTKVD